MHQSLMCFLLMSAKCGVLIITMTKRAVQAGESSQRGPDVNLLLSKAYSSTRLAHWRHMMTTSSRPNRWPGCLGYDGKFIPLYYIVKAIMHYPEFRNLAFVEAF